MAKKVTNGMTDAFPHTTLETAALAALDLLAQKLAEDETTLGD
jgi:hypothetical protein